MAAPNITPTGVERHFDPDQLMVSKTDLKGIVTYANKSFLEVSGYSEAEVVGEPHNCIRHPDMPRMIFRLLWDRIQSGKEIFAYVENLCNGGDHYWVFAHVTPTFDLSGRIIGYHSNRRSADPQALAVVRPFYQRLLAAERAAPNRREAVEAGVRLFELELEQQGQSYDEWVWSLEPSLV